MVQPELMDLMDLMDQPDQLASEDHREIPDQLALMVQPELMDLMDQPDQLAP
jgi:hypothetical protein